MEVSFFSLTFKVGEKRERRAQRAHLPTPGAAGLSKYIYISYQVYIYILLAG